MNAGDKPVVTQRARDAAKALLDQLAIRFHQDGTFRDWDNTVEAFARFEQETLSREGRDVFDREPSIVAHSPEPSLRCLVKKYYNEHFIVERADELTEQYFAALSTAPASPEQANQADVLRETLAKIMPINVHNGPDYAEVYFGDGETHSTQAMTMHPQDWLDLQAALSQGDTP